MRISGKPAYLYARYSSARQKNGSSVERQMEYGRKFIAQHGWHLVSEIKDEAKSAFKGANRAEGSALFEFEKQAASGQFADGAVLVCENVDRLSRQGAKATARLIWALNEAGVDVATYHDGHIYKAGEKTDLMDLFSAIIKGALGEEESAKKSARSQAWWDKIYKEISAGSTKAHSKQIPAWIDIVDGEFVLNEHRAEIVRKMFRWYCDGLGSLQILYKLRAMKERPWSKEKRYKDRPEWTLRYISKVLKARQTIGEYVTVKGETIATNFYPAVVDVQTFNLAQTIREQRAKLGGDARKRSHNLFVGFLKCGQCGKSATLTSKMTKKRGMTYYARCNEARYQHVDCDNHATVLYHVLERTVLDEALSWIAEAQTKSTSSEAFKQQIAELTRQRALKEIQSQNIVEAIQEGTAPRALVKRLSELEAEIEGLDTQIQLAKNQLSVETNKAPRSSVHAEVEALRESILDPDPDVRFEARASVNAALSQLIHRIDIEPTGTFRIYLTESDWWHFDADGALLEAEQSIPLDAQEVLKEMAGELPPA